MTDPDDDRAVPPPPGQGPGPAPAPGWVATGSYWRAVVRALMFGGLGVLLLVTGNLVGVLPLVVGLAYGVIARFRRAARG